MIVTCNNCDTSFQLDESRVPEQGIRVRCSRCKEAFFLGHPSASASDAIHGVAQSAAAAGGAAPPSTTQDLTAPLGQGQGEDEEHDWEFNVDPPAHAASSPGVPQPPQPQAEPAPDEALAIDEVQIDDSDDLVGSGLALEGEEEVADAPVASEGSAFGSVDDYSSLMPEDDGSASSADTGASDGGVPVEAKPINRAHAGRYAATGPSEDLGDPESWDFFGDDSGDAQAPGSPGPGAVLGRIALTSARSDSPMDATQFPDLAAWDEDPYEDVEEVAEPGFVLRTLGLLGHSLGWAITLSLVSIALVSGFWSTAESLVSSPQDVRLGGIDARGIMGHWVETARGETLLWVKGELVNGTTAVALLDGILEVSLIDANGRSLDVDPQPAALALTEADIRELPPRALRIAIDRGAWGLARHRLGQNDPITFHAVFREVPSSATRVALSIADNPNAAYGAAADPGGPAPAVAVDTATPLTPAHEADLQGPSRVPSVERTTPTSNSSPLADELTWGE